MGYDDIQHNTHTYVQTYIHIPMIYVAEAKTLAVKKMTPTEPPNSGPNALLIITKGTSQEKQQQQQQQQLHSISNANSRHSTVSEILMDLTLSYRIAQLFWG